MAVLAGDHGPPPRPHEHRHRRRSSSSFPSWSAWWSGDSSPAWWPWCAGFFVYDLVFIPPYGTLTVGDAENWVALGVYVVVMVLVAQVVARLDAARSQAGRREAEVRRLFELTELLIGEKPVPELLGLIVSTVHDAFGFESVALLLPSGSRLEVAAAAGEPLTGDELEPHHTGAGAADEPGGVAVDGRRRDPERGPDGHGTAGRAPRHQGPCPQPPRP